MLITEEIQPSKKRYLGLTISSSKLLILDRQDTGLPLVLSSLETNYLNGVEILKDMSPLLDNDAVFSQFIRSSTLMSKTPASDYSGDTLVFRRDSTSVIVSPEPEKEDLCGPKPKRIQLLLNSTSDKT